MARCRLDDQDKRALRKLDFVLSADAESATIAGEMEVAVVRSAADRFELTITFPNGEDFLIRLARSQLLEQLDIEADEG